MRTVVGHEAACWVLVYDNDGVSKIHTIGLDVATLFHSESQAEFAKSVMKLRHGEGLKNLRVARAVVQLKAEIE